MPKRKIVSQGVNLHHLYEQFGSIIASILEHDGCPPAFADLLQTFLSDVDAEVPIERNLQKVATSARLALPETLQLIQ